MSGAPSRRMRVDLEKDDGGGALPGSSTQSRMRTAGDGAGFCAEPALADEVGGEEFLEQAEARCGEEIVPGSRR